MPNIYDLEVADFYLITNRETNKKYFGYKPLNKGKSAESYITSSENPELHEDWANGKCDRYLIKHSEDIGYVEKLEGFAIEYLISSKPELSYNLKNNGRKGDPKITLSDYDRVNIMNCVDDNIIPWETRGEDEIRKLVKDMIQKEADGYYPIEMVPIDEVMSYKSNQVKGEALDQAQITRTVEKMEQYPEQAREVLKPVSVVIKNTVNGKVLMILNGHHTRECVDRARGWNKCPVIFHDESEFGDNEVERLSIYRLFGLQANPKDFVEKKATSKEDCVRDLLQEIELRGLDLSVIDDQERTLEISLSRYGGPDMLGTDTQARGVFTTILNRYNMDQAVKSVGTVRTYSDPELRVRAAKLRNSETSVVVSHFGNAAHAKALGYIIRNMKNENKHKGIIVFHARNREDIVRELQGDDGGWINDTENSIKHMNLDIEVVVLPTNANS